MVFSAKKAWLLLALYILGADYILIKKGQSTMSSQFLSWASHPTRRFATATITIYIVCHLYNRPKKLTVYDPLKVMADLVRKSCSAASSAITEDFISL